MASSESVFQTLNGLNVNEHVEQKEVGGKELTYLSWTWAWAEVKKRYPDAHYNIWRDENGLPYVVDPATGYMVFTDMTIDGVTHIMWLAVMDGANNAMKPEPYTYKVKNPRFKYAKKQADGRYLDSYGNEQKEFLIKTVEAATMTDVNKALMRCLVKNLAMFGLGLYIYAGEDLPETEQDKPDEQPKQDKPDEQPKLATTRVVNTDVVVDVVDKVPPVPRKEPKAEVTPVERFLVTAMTGLREAREISAAQNNKLFKEQWKVLVKAKLAPDKPLKEYTMEEAEALIDAMYKCFQPNSTTLKTE